MPVLSSLPQCRGAFRAAAVSCTAALCTVGGAAMARVAPALSPLATPAVHVSGRYLTDGVHKHLTLHGFWEPIDSWFNGEGKSYQDPTDWTKPDQYEPVLRYQVGILKILSTRTPMYGESHGWSCNLVRFTGYRCPGWDYDTGALTQPEQFQAYLHNFLIPYINYCRERGVYVVLVGNPTGQEQGMHWGDNGKNMTATYQKTLLNFWRVMSSTPGIANASNVQFELCNEPNGIETEPGNGKWGNGDDAHFAALAKFMQPIVDLIRRQKANNLIWVPSLADQQQNHGFLKYPIHGKDVAYAAHIYPGYVSGSTNGGDANIRKSLVNIWNYEFKGAADKFPMMITESWWRHYTPEELQKTPYNGLFNANTGDETYGYGSALKHVVDAEGNISYVIGTPRDLLTSIGTTKGGTDFSQVSIADGDGARAAFNWYPEYLAMQAKAAAHGKH